jgi:hypothetical protein
LGTHHHHGLVLHIRFCLPPTYVGSDSAAPRPGSLTSPQG